MHGGVFIDAILRTIVLVNFFSATKVVSLACGVYYVTITRRDVCAGR
jgi:hypothetical protein